MTTLTIHIEDMNQDAAIRTLLDALHVRYEESGTGMDETEYLQSSSANATRLNQSIEDLNKGKGTEINPDSLFQK